MQRRHVNQVVDGLDAGIARIEPSNAYRSHKDIADALIDGLEPDPFAAQDSCHIPVTTKAADIAAGHYALNEVAVRIVQLGHADRVWTRRAPIVHGRCLIAPQRLVRTLMIVNVEVAIERTLLVLEIALDAATAL